MSQSMWPTPQVTPLLFDISLQGFISRPKNLEAESFQRAWVLIQLIPRREKKHTHTHTQTHFAHLEKNHPHLSSNHKNFVSISMMKLILVNTFLELIHYNFITQTTHDIVQLKIALLNTKILKRLWLLQGPKNRARATDYGSGP